jgi:hypothetical protein
MSESEGDKIFRIVSNPHAYYHLEYGVRQATLAYIREHAGHITARDFLYALQRCLQAGEAGDEMVVQDLVMSIVPSGHSAVAKVLVTFLTGSDFLYPDQPDRLLGDIVALCVQTKRIPLLQELKKCGCPNLIREVLTYAAEVGDKDVYYLFLADASTEDVDFVNTHKEGAMGEFERWSLLRVGWIETVVLQGARGSRAGGGASGERGSGSRVVAKGEVIYILDEDEDDDVTVVKEEEDEDKDTRPSRRRRGGE